MRSADADDLSTRARIRDAAILRFGRDGYDATSVRAIAAEAGVSPALVIHHFGSKDALRGACEAFIVEELFDRKSLLDSPRLSDELQRWLGDVERFRPWLDYLARMLTSTTPAANRLFDAMLASTRDMLAEQTDAGAIRASDDPEMRAIVVALSGLATLTLSHQLSRVLGAPVFGTEVVRRMTIPTLEIYTHGLYTDDRYLLAAREALERTAGPRSDKGENDPNQDPDPPAAAGS